MGHQERGRKALEKRMILLECLDKFYTWRFPMFCGVERKNGFNTWFSGMIFKHENFVQCIC